MSDTSHGSGVSATGVLLIVFIALKLTDNVAWSWLWVLSPAWIPVALVVAVMSCVFAVKLPCAILEMRRRRATLNEAYQAMKRRP
jgi:hypothetical protein